MTGDHGAAGTSPAFLYTVFGRSPPEWYDSSSAARSLAVGHSLWLKGEVAHPKIEATLYKPLLNIQFG